MQALCLNHDLSLRNCELLPLSTTTEGKGTDPSDGGNMTQLCVSGIP